MNKVLLVVSILVIVCSLAVSANADSDGSWLVYIKAYNAAGTGSFATWGKFGTDPTYKDEYVPFEDAKGTMVSTQAAVYCIDLDPSYKWITDKRYSATNAAKTWNLKLEVGTAFPNDRALIRTWIRDFASESFQPSSDWSLTLQESNGGSWNTIHTYNGYKGSEVDPEFSFLADVAPGAVYDYRLVYAPVPEPSSILSLIIGLGSLGGIVWPRRKRKF